MPSASPASIDARQADQVGVIIFALLERRQRVAVDLDQLAAQRLGGGAVGDAVEAGDGGLAARPEVAELALLAADVDATWRARLATLSANSLSLSFALDAMRPGDRGQRDALVASGRR